MLNHFFTSFVVLILLLYIFVFNTKSEKIFSFYDIFFIFNVDIRFLWCIVIHVKRNKEVDV
nr:MAG TPA: hypothetical protein [Caudoviricetes sp.]